MKPLRSAIVIALLLAVGASSACMKKKIYPDPLPGWHNDDYSVIFGRIQRVAAKTSDAPPVWVVRFDHSTTKFGGELALTPPPKLIGYSGGELVEIHGTPRPELGSPDYPGNWYEIRSIRLWVNKR